MDIGAGTVAGDHSRTETYEDGIYEDNFGSEVFLDDRETVPVIYF